MNLLLPLLAQTTQPGAQGQMSGSEFFFRTVVPIFLVFAVFMWWSSRSKNKERRQFEEMLNSLGRNDRIQTIGGILGTVVETRGNEVVVKVDETNNVKMRFNRSAIKEVIRESSDPK